MPKATQRVRIWTQAQLAPKTWASLGLLCSLPSVSRKLLYFQRSPPPGKTDLQDLCFPRDRGKPLQSTDGVLTSQLCPLGSRPQLHPVWLPCGGEPVESSKPQTEIGKCTFTYFFHNRLKYTLGTIWWILFSVLSLILAENFRENLQLDLKYFGSLLQHSSTSNSYIPTVKELKEYTDKCVFASQVPYQTSSLVLTRCITLSRMAMLPYSNVVQYCDI